MYYPLTIHFSNMSRPRRSPSPVHRTDLSFLSVINFSLCCSLSPSVIPAVPWLRGAGGVSPLGMSLIVPTAPAGSWMCSMSVPRTAGMSPASSWGWAPSAASSLHPSREYRSQIPGFCSQIPEYRPRIPGSPSRGMAEAELPAQGAGIVKSPPGKAARARQVWGEGSGQRSPKARRCRAVVVVWRPECPSQARAGPQDRSHCRRNVPSSPGVLEVLTQGWHRGT